MNALQNLEAISQRLTTAEAEVKTLRADLARVTAERDKLTAADKSASTKAKEQLAANGVAPAPKDTPEALADTQSDASLFERYQSLQGKERMAFLEKHEAALTRHAERVSGE